MPAFVMLTGSPLKLNKLSNRIGFGYMSILVVTDIFGLCRSTDKLFSYLKTYSSDVFIIEPYQGERYSFENENDAYKAFINKCGHDNYLDLTKESIARLKPKYIIGFSAGASAVWRLSGLENTDCEGMLGFYPTHIRNHLDITPKISMNLIFPFSEESFDVKRVSDHVSLSQNVTSELTSYNHGFMNQNSKAYSAKAYRYGINAIEKRLNL